MRRISRKISEIDTELNNLDSLNFPVREQGPETGLVRPFKYHSKICMDKNLGRAPSGVHSIPQQKGTPYGVPFKMVDRTGLEPVTSCV